MQLHRTLLCISPINWDDVWEGPQEVSIRFARAGWQVVFVENLGGRTPRLGWHDAKRIAARVKRLTVQPVFTSPAPNRVVVHTSLSLPPYNLPWIRRRNISWLAGGLSKRLRTLNCNQPVIWTYNPSGVVLEACKALHPALTIYCCINDYARLSPEHAAVIEDEKQMIRAADLVFVVPRQLFAAKQALRPDVYLLPQGANLQHYLSPERIGTAVELLRMPRPIIGYIGTIHEWFDQELLRFAAQARPQWSFVLIGPKRVNTSRLRDISNVLFLDFKAHDTLPAYVAEFDVGIIPYITEGFGKMTRPNKVLEYLVMGKPVVSTALPELADLGAHLFSANSAGQFVQAIELALSSDSPGKHAKRREIAIANSIDRKFSEVEQLVVAKLGERTATPQAEAVS